MSTETPTAAAPATAELSNVETCPACGSPAAVLDRKSVV